MKRLLCLALLSGFGIWGQSLVRQEDGYWVRTAEGSIAGAGVEKLAVTTWGDVSFEGTDSEELSYSLETKVHAGSKAEAARLLDSIRGSTQQKADVVYFRFEGDLPNQISASLSIAAPRRLAKSYLRTRAGSITARGLQGKLVAESGGGRIVADQIEGGLHAETIGGEIRVGRVNGGVRCASGAGNIHVEYAGGESWFDTVGGEIYVVEVAGDVHLSNGGGNIFVQKAGGSVVAHTTEGLIEVQRAQGHVYADTASGSIAVLSASGARCESSGGAIKLKEVSGSVHASTASGNILAVLARGVPIEDSFLDTGLGDVTVYLPSNLAVTVNAYNTPAGKAGQIVSEFPQVRTAAEETNPYQTVVASGTLNGGGPVLKVSAAGGTIYLKRR